jgi:predicted nucleotidyltransferase
MELLRKSIAARKSACEQARLRVRERLAEALAVHLTQGSRVWVYGSLVEPDRFREWSDVDLALECDPPGMNIYLLASLLAERCERRVDFSNGCRLTCPVSGRGSCRWSTHRESGN